MKKLFVVLLLLISGWAIGQSVTGQGLSDCGTETPTNYSKWRNNTATVNNLVSTLKHDICVNKKFSIVFYVVADSNGTWGTLTPANLDTSIAVLNRAFGRICASFMNCSTAVIPNYEYNNWEKTGTENYVVGNWHTDSTISVYLPAVINGTPSGYAYMPPSTRNVIVVEKTSVTSVTIIHEMGHFFGLPHTFEEIGGSVSPAPPPGVGSNEFVDRTNCYTHGDGFCDTEADCYPLGTGAKDGFNKYYVIPKDNYMSYQSPRCRFTQEQYNFMANVMMTQRLYLH